MGKVTIHTNRIWLFVVYGLWFAITLIGLMSAFDNMMGDNQSYKDGFLYLILDVLCLAHIFSTSRMAYPKLIITGACLLAVQILGMLVAKTGGITVMIMRTSLWMLMMIALYKYLMQNATAVDYFVKLASIGLIILSVYIAERSYYFRNVLQYSVGMNQTYNALFLTPLLFFTSSKRLRVIGLVAVGAMVLMSMKLTAIVALLIGLTIYAMIDGSVKNKKLNAGLIVFLAALLILWVCFPMINKKNFTICFMSLKKAKQWKQSL